MKKFKIFALVSVLGLILVLSTGCLQNAGINQENEGLTPEEQITPPSVVVPPVEIPAPLAPEIPAPVPPLP